MKYQKITNLPDIKSGNVPRCFTKTGKKFMISQVLPKIDINQVNK